MDIRFEWNERKRLSNLRRHGFDFRDAALVFKGPTFTFADERYLYPESRFITLGLLRSRAVVVVHTEDAEHIRIISLRRANRHEEALLFEKTWFGQIPDGLEEDSRDEG